MPTTALDVDRYLIAAAVVLTCVLFLPAAFDPVNVIKLTALLLVAIALVVSVVVRVARDRVLHLPLSVAGGVGVALAVALTVSAVVAPVTNTAVLGAYGRNSGLLAYLAAVLLFLVGLRVFQRPGTRVLVGGVVAAGLFTATYGLMQRVGWDSIPWNNPFNPIIAGLGNPNFAAGYLGIAASVAAGGALWAGWAVGWRVACAGTAVLCLLAAALSGAAQGLIAAGGGLFVVAVAAALDLRRTRRLVALGVLTAAATVTGALLVLGAVSTAGPLAFVFTDAGSKARAYYWEAALAMFGDKPLLGVGLDQYGNYWRSTRSTASVGYLGGPSYSDAAHSVPLQMLAQGGLLLGAVYAVFLAVTAFALVRGLVQLRGADRMLLASVGAGWVAYQVQSAVSIDQVPLIVLHFALAGGVVAAGGSSGLREVRLPGALQPVVAHPNDAKARRRAPVAAPRRRAMDGADIAVVSVVGLVAVVAAFQSLAPLRASTAVKSAAAQLAQGDGTAALASYERAMDLVPGQSYYAILKGGLYDQAQQPASAQAAYELAAAKDPFEVNAVKAAAARAETNGQLERARELLAQAVRLDPNNDETLEQAAQFELRHDGVQAARTLLEAATERLPGSAKVAASLGDVRLALGDEAGARQAYDRALAINPSEPIAVAGLTKL